MIDLPTPSYVTHWLPQDPAVSTITACGLDIDKNGIAWSRVRLPHGRQHGCPTCRDNAVVRVTTISHDGGISDQVYLDTAKTLDPGASTAEAADWVADERFRAAVELVWRAARADA